MGCMFPSLADQGKAVVLSVFRGLSPPFSNNLIEHNPGRGSLDLDQEKTRTRRSPLREPHLLDIGFLKAGGFVQGDVVDPGEDAGVGGV